MNYLCCNNRTCAFLQVASQVVGDLFLQPGGVEWPHHGLYMKPQHCAGLPDSPPLLLYHCNMLSEVVFCLSFLCMMHCYFFFSMKYFIASIAPPHAALCNAVLRYFSSCSILQFLSSTKYFTISIRPHLAAESRGDS